MPTGITSLLGLGLKYCIQMPRPTNKLSKTTDRLKNDIRRIYHFKYNPPENAGEITYIPELYLSADWQAPVCPDPQVEKALNSFVSSVANERGRYQQLKPSNLTPSHWKLIEKYKSNDQFIIIEADKNLGGCILLQDTYISRGISKHLSNRDVYQPLSKHEATVRHKKLRNKVESFTNK
ncbi:hypothetical protein ACHAXR_004739 [Thalassiosira sp. AJA248-18]